MTLLQVDAEGENFSVKFALGMSPEDFECIAAAVLQSALKAGISLVAIAAKMAEAELIRSETTYKPTSKVQFSRN